MRIFWIVLIIFIAGTGFVVFSDDSKPTPTPALQTAAPAPSPTVSDEPARQEIVDELPESAPVATEEAIEIADELINEAPESASNELATETPVPAPVIEESSTEIAEASEGEAVETDAIEEDDELALVDLTAEDIAEALTETAADPAPTGWEELAKTSDEETAAGDESLEAPAVVHLTVTETEEGTLRIGDKFTITGKGTKESPYALPWDFLVTIREAYSPREGKKAIPDHFAFFDGKYISIAGYLQFPLAKPEPTECLVMLNQWDGCCIGVPPTPYDAIEVALSIPATQSQKFAVEGRIVGKLDIDPYLVGNWLIGLYLIGDATVDVSGSRTAEELYGNTPSQFLPGQ